MASTAFSNNSLFDQPCPELLSSDNRSSRDALLRPPAASGLPAQNQFRDETAAYKAVIIIIEHSGLSGSCKSHRLVK